MAETCKEAVWLASLLLTNDRGYSAAIYQLAKAKNEVEAKIASGLYKSKELRNLYERLHTIEVKIDIFTEAKLLARQGNYVSLGAGARDEVLNYLSKSGWDVGRSAEFVASLTKVNPENGEELTKLLVDGNVEDIDAFLNDFKEKLARYVKAKDAMRTEQGIKTSLSDKLAEVEIKHMNTSTGGSSIQSTSKAAMVSTSTRDDIVRAIDTEGATPKVEQPKLFRRITGNLGEYETLTEKEVREIVYKYFDSNEVTVTFANNLRTPEGQAAFGEYFNGMVRFAKNPMKYTPEHEVVHAYMDLCISRAEKREILGYAMIDFSEKNIKEYMKVNGISNINVAVEEMIADGFVKYIQRKATFTGRLKNFFDDLRYRIKKIFGNEDKVRALYNDIESRARRSKVERGHERLNSTKWHGDELANNIGKFLKTPDDVKSFNDSVLGGVLRHGDNPGAEYMVASTILGYDTNINWNSLIVSVDAGKLASGINPTVHGVYLHPSHQLIVGAGDHTVPHEMTHALDDMFFQEIFGLREMTSLTDACVGGYSNSMLTETQRALRDEFEKFLDNMMKDADGSSFFKFRMATSSKGFREYAHKLGEHYARFGEMFIMKTLGVKNTSYLGEVFSDETIKMYTDWLSHMAEARARGELHSTMWLTTQGATGPKFKIAEDSATESITTQKIKSDPMLQAEYASRIESIKILQQMNAENLETLKNFGGLFGHSEGLFGTAKIVDMGDDMINLAKPYLNNGEDIKSMTVSDLRVRMQEKQKILRQAGRQRNIIAQMERAREEGEQMLDEIFKVDSFFTSDGVALKIDGRLTKEGANVLLRSLTDDDSKILSSKSTTTKKASKINTSKEGKGTNQTAETWKDLEKNGTNKVDTEEGVNPEINDPITKTTLSKEAEDILKEEIQKDIDQVKNGEAPSNVGTADDIWKEFWEASDDIVEREIMLNNFLIGKIYLGENNETLETALKRLNGRNLSDYAALTLKQIDKITDLKQLEQVVYTHIGDIIYDKAIRTALKDKQYELWTTIDVDDMQSQYQALSKARSLQKTAEFLEAGGQFTNVTLYDRVGSSLKGIFDDIEKDYNNRDLYDEFVTAVTNFSSNMKPKTATVGGKLMTADDLIKGIYVISRDDLVKDVASLDANPKDVLKVAAKKLFDIGSDAEAKAAEKRIDDLFSYYTPKDLSDADIAKMAYATTAYQKIEGEMTDVNVIFYNYRDGLYAGNPQTSYGEFFDEITKQNSLIIDKEHNVKEVFKVKDIPSDVKYIIVNDNQRRSDVEFKTFYDSIPEEKRPLIIYPRGGISNSYYVENGKVKFKTTSNQFYNEVTRDLSAKTLGTYARNIEKPTEESAKELENKALEYFRTIMGLDMKGAPVNKAEYKEWIINNLRIITGLPISAEMDVYNSKSTWKMANEIIRYQLGATGRYTAMIRNVEDIVTEINAKYTNDIVGLFNDIKAIVGGDDNIMAKNAELIKKEYIKYSTAPTIESKIQSKGTLMALCNGGEYDKINVSLFNAALIKDDFVSILGPIIYGAREYTDVEINALNKLGNDILSMYIFDLGSNIVRNTGYSMPLISPAYAIRKFLKGEPIISDDFVQAFIKKNGLEQNEELIEGIFREALPDELDIVMDISELMDMSIVFPNIVIEEVPNVIIPTNYNQLLAVVRKSGSKGGGITWDEEGIIKGILDNYYRVVSDSIEAGTMTPTLAQQLKLQAGWALDMAEQDLLITKYNSFLTLEERDRMMGGKYKLRIANTKDELKNVKAGNDIILNGYRSSLGEMGKKWMKSYGNVEEARKDLIERGVVMANVGGKVVTANVHDLLIQQLETLPSGLRGIFKNFENLTVSQIKNIDYAQTYAIIKAIDLAKNASARGNLYSRLMYKQNPQLANIDFFRRYQLNSDGIPYALQRNAAGLVDASISDGIDTMFKQDIMLEISSIMKNKGVLTEEQLEDIVIKELSEKAENETIKNHYINMFKAYTYLTDIPRDVKVTINQMLDAQLKEIRNELKSSGSDFINSILDSRITLNDGTDMTIRDLISGDIDAYKKNLFIEKLGDGTYNEVTMKAKTSQELGLTESQVLELSDSMYSMLNQLDSVTDIERKMNTVILGDARQILNKYTTTKKLIDADYLIGGQNDLLKNLIRSNAFSKWGQLWGDQDIISKAFGRFTGKTFFNKENRTIIRDYYYTYYRQPLDVLENMKISNDLQATALEMARYFKRIEGALGSVDGIGGASINTDLNRAFGMLGTVVKNINTSSQVNDLMTSIANNQILSFFKFAKEGDGAYFKLFSDISTNKLKRQSIEYIRDVELEDVKKFNEVFNSNLSRGEYVIVMQALGGYRIGGPVHQWINAFGRFINFTTGLGRALISYPFQLLTIAPQSIAYNLKANGYKRALGIEDMGEINDIREFYDILTSDYVELNPKGWAKARIKNVLSRYGGKEVSDLMKNEKVEMDDSIIELFGKSYSHATKNYRWQQFLQLLDATRDNANNIIDALMAQKFKNLAFAKALKYNNVMPFNNADAFKRFMDDVSIPQDIKNNVLDSVKIYSGRIFKDMLGTGFSGLDKMYGANVAQDILIGLMNTINFRGAWGLNMFRQALGKFWSTAKILMFVGDRRAIGQAVDYIKRTPEFSDLSQAMFNDLVWMWKLGRFSDNGKVPSDESEVDFMDFCEWSLSNFEMVSQQWQGIMSFGPMRPLIAQGEAIWKHQRNPEQYGDPYGIGAFINTLVSNFGRNWKPRTFVLKALRAAQADGDMSRAWDYVADHYHELSAGTLRFMLEEGYNDYGSNTPLVYEVGGIPSFIAGEQWEGSDTAYLYKMKQNETWEYLKGIREGKEGYKAGGLFTSLMGSSQFINAIKESYLLYKYATADTKEEKTKYRSSKSTYGLEDMDKAYAGIPEWEERRTTGFIKPKREDGYMKYYDDIINTFTEGTNPGGSKFVKGLRNFLDYGHVNGKEEGSYYDKILEEFYTRIQEKDPNAINNILRNDTLLTQIATEDTAGAIQTELSWAMRWLQEFDGDPEYNKYAAMIYKGVMSNVMYNELQAFADEKTREYQASGQFTKKKDKWSASNIKDTIYYDDFKQDFVDNHFDDLMVADVEGMQTAMVNHLYRTSKEIGDMFFVEKTFENDDGTTTTKMYLKSNLRTQVKQLTDFQAALDAGEWERAVVDGTAITKTFSYDHPVSTQVALYIFNRIKSSDNLTEKEKAEAMTEFVANNLEAFEWDSEFASENPELYEEAKGYYNEINYQVNSELISAANDYALSLNSDKEDSKSGGGSGFSLKLSSISNALRKNQQNTSGGARGNGNGHTMTWLKAPILDPTKVFVEDSKVPTINFNPKFTSRAYTPKTNLGGSKTTAKPVKVKKTKVKEKDIEVI